MNEQNAHTPGCDPWIASVVTSLFINTLCVLNYSNERKMKLCSVYVLEKHVQKPNGLHLLCTKCLLTHANRLFQMFQKPED